MSHLGFILPHHTNGKICRGSILERRGYVIIQIQSHISECIPGGGPPSKSSAVREQFVFSDVTGGF
eukprot:m.393234 g.393234  ORF g.393234 m.393234 type:complete len:66 (-) comp21087_c1_seq14:2518-2715(-)